jgi:hypothetical protein
MRIALTVLALFGAVCLAMGQAVVRWQRTYSVSGYETLFAALQHDGAGTLYLLASLRQLEGEDAVSLVRYTLRGAPLDARPYAYLQRRPGGGLWATGTTQRRVRRCLRPLRTDLGIGHSAPRADNCSSTILLLARPTFEQRANGLPTLRWRGAIISYFIATQTPRGQIGYIDL